MRRINKDLLLAFILFTVTAATRLPFQSHSLNTWDSVGYALGLERFSIAEQQPVPAGYILYEALGRLSHLFFTDANTALVMISILGSGAAVAGIFLLGFRLFDRVTGALAAVLLLLSPLGWFYAEVSLTYAVAAPFAIAGIWCLYRLFFEKRGAVAAAVLIGLIGGVRLDLLLFLGPIWLIGSLRVRRKEMLLSWAAMATGIALWLIPLVLISGGINDYLQASSQQFDTAVRPYTVFAGGLMALKDNLRGVWQASVWLLGAGFIFLVYLLALPFRGWIVGNGGIKGDGGSVARAGRLDHRDLFLLAVISPALFYFLIFQIGQPGYLLVWAGPVVLLIARLAICNARDLDQLLAMPQSKAGGLRKPGVIFVTVAVLLIAVANVYLFMGAERVRQRLPFTEAAVRTVFGPYSKPGINRADRRIDAAVASIRQFDSGKTVIVVGELSEWRKLMYYLPEDHVLILDPVGAGYSDGLHHHYTVSAATQIGLAPEVDTIVFVNMDPGLVPGLSPVQTDQSADIMVTSARVPAAGTFRLGLFEVEHSGSPVG